MRNTINFPEKPRRLKSIDVLAAGELLVDLLSAKKQLNLGEADSFHRRQGGSPANFAANLARLGNSAALVACVGNESLGTYLINEIKQTGIITDHIVTDPVAPTSIVLVTKTENTPDFIAYRMADRMLQPEHITSTLLQRCSIFHTTCFALSLEPSRSSILNAAAEITNYGGRLSLDANYAPSIWGDIDEAQKIIAEYCSNGALVKISLDDISRLFRDSNLTPDAAIKAFHDWGAELVCLTLGADGNITSWEYGKHRSVSSATPVRVVDATGAGDAFWAGFITAWLDGYQPADCQIAGSKFAAMKLVTDGALPNSIPRKQIYNNE